MCITEPKRIRLICSGYIVLNETSDMLMLWSATHIKLDFGCILR